MPLTSGARLGPYEIVSALGSGGMGEVWKARDTRLDRIVAIKRLPPEFCSRPERHRRFQTEARAISSLSHPHICTLFDVGEQDGLGFLVMEHLEGETLDDRLARGPLPAHDVLRFGSQIADALDHAHRRGIVHRDLKPSNVMLTEAGTKLLDFGLAKLCAVEAPLSASTVSLEPHSQTADGTVLGTFRYMSPEQVEGKEVDARSDIFALGSLLFEMAMRQKAFQSDSQARLIAAILTEDPPSISMQSAFDDPTRPAFDHLVKRCLAKDPDARWQTARDVKLELDWLLQQSTAENIPHSRKAALLRRPTIGYLATAAVVVAAVALVVARPPRRDTEPIHVTVSLPPGGIISPGEALTRMAVSPDGRRVAFVVSSEGQEQIWVRAFDSSAAEPVAGTEGANSPFWSPDSRFIGFFVPAEGRLKKVDLVGTPPLTICSAEIDGLPAWSDETILFTQVRDGIYRVPEDGGTPVRVTRLDPEKETNHYWPSFLPDGRHFFYMASARDSEGERVTPAVYVGSLDSDDVKLIAHLNSRMVYSPPGYVLFVQDGVLLAQRFDTERLEVVGEPAKVVDGLAYYRTVGSAGFSVSDTGVLAYHAGVPTSRLVWFDRHGQVGDLNWPVQRFGSLRFSPDGGAVAADVTDPRTGTKDIWTFDVARGVPMRVTSEVTNESDPVWSPDGRRILFRSDRRGAPSLFVKTPGGSGQDEQMMRGGGPLSPEDWSSDGRWIAYVNNNRQRGSHLWMLPATAGDRSPRSFGDARFEESGARFSPDSQWLAFVSEESGTSEVYVAPVSGTSGKVRISTSGGVAPRWRRDGRELFYASADNMSVMAVPMTLTPTLQAGSPARLFTIGTGAGYTRRARNMAFDVAPDGRRFLVSVPVDPSAASFVNVVFNWSARLP